jgi:NAD(P)-dependent dehydrogenase (short-subunit alcohol dehydrogenase family)
MNHKRIRIITGANKGIGFEIARQLGSDHGMTVLVGARDEARGREALDKLTALGLDAHTIHLDVTDPASVEAAKTEIEHEFGGQLDVLIYNAGVVLDWNPPSETDLAKFKATYETNVVGPLRVTKVMLPLLRRSAAGRVVNMSSCLGSLTQNNDPTWGEAGSLQLVQGGVEHADGAFRARASGGRQRDQGQLGGSGLHRHRSQPVRLDDPCRSVVVYKLAITIATRGISSQRLREDLRRRHLGF